MIDENVWIKFFFASITAKGDSVIIKAGGIEVVIDSKGLVVKGGEIKAEWEAKKRKKLSL